MKFCNLKAFGLAVAFAALSTHAFAQSFGGGNVTFPGPNTANTGTGSMVAKSVTATSSTVVGANSARNVLTFKNQGTIGTVAICPSTVSTPSLGQAGCIDLAPGQFVSLCSSTYCPGDAFVGVAGLLTGTITSVPLTVMSQ